MKIENSSCYKKHYYQFHKPAGCVTALSDQSKPTIMNYLQEIDMTKVRPVGRLDLDTEGLLILTDDGHYNQKMTHPDHGIEKEYFFYAIGTYTEEKQKILLEGMEMGKRNSKQDAKPALLRLEKEYQFETIPKTIKEKLNEKTLKNKPSTPVFSGYMTVTEGKKHEVKRLLKSIGCYCIYLKRIRMGEVTLFDDLPIGQVREFFPDLDV